MWSAAAMIGTMFMASTLVTPLYVPYQQAFGFSTIALTLIYSTLRGRKPAGVALSRTNIG